MKFSCENIKKIDYTSESDGILKVFENQAGKWVEVLKTKMIKNDKNPAFEEVWDPAAFNMVQFKPVKIELWDGDNYTGNVYIGEIETTL